MQNRGFLVLVAVVLTPLSVHAQVIRLGSDSRRTIETTTTEKISVLADAAIVKFGYTYTADTKDSAYAESVKAGNKIIKAIAGAGIPSDQIHSEALTLVREDDSLQREAKSAAKPKYSALQEWRVHVSAVDAQKVIDLAVMAGANNIQGVEWTVDDPQMLRAKAYGVALERAKEMAAQSATQAGVKLGELVAIINGEESERFDKIAPAKRVTIEVQAAPLPNLVLFPGKVEREATVTVIYAIAQDSRAQ